MTVLASSKIRFLIVGSFCAVLHNAVMIGGDFIGMHYLISSICSYVTVVAVGYALHATYTFREDRQLASFLKYAATMTANYPLSVALTFVMCDLAGLSVAFAAPLATAAMVLWNFVASRWAIVRRRPETA